MSKSATPPPPHVLVEAEPFIPYMKEEDFAPSLQPVWIASCPRDT